MGGIPRRGRRVENVSSLTVASGMPDARHTVALNVYLMNKRNCVHVPTCIQKISFFQRYMTIRFLSAKS